MQPSTELALWEVDLADPGWDAHAGVLDAAERIRFDRLRVPAIAAAARRARVALRHILARHLGAGPHELVFAYGAHGKPALVGAGLPHFNLSHCDDRAFVAVDVAPVGIDIERCDRPVPDLDHLIAFSCAPDERAALAALSPETRRDGFFRLWTRKEAYCKAIGLGLARRLDRLVIAKTPAGHRVVDRDDPAASRPVLDLAAGPGWAAALCAVRTVPPPACRLATPDAARAAVEV